MKEKLIPILSIAIGFIAFVLTLQYWKGKREEIEKERMALLKAMETLPVVVAYRDIPQGAKIAQNDLTEKTIPKPRIPKDAVYRADALKILGKKSLFQINKDEPISWSSIEGGSPDAYGLAPMITHRMRAVSLPVSGSAAVSSMVRPNDRIDVLGTFSFPFDAASNGAPALQALWDAYLGAGNTFIDATTEVGFFTLEMTGAYAAAPWSPMTIDTTNLGGPDAPYSGSPDEIAPGTAETGLMLNRKVANLGNQPNFQYWRLFATAKLVG